MTSLGRISRTAALAALSAATLALSPATAHAQPCDPAWQPGFGYPGLDRLITASAVFDDGRGPAVYVAGDFTTAGETVVNHIARWTTDHWEPLGEGLHSQANPGLSVTCMTVFDDGSGGGPALFVAGGFNQAGGLPAGRIAKWDGHAWSTLDGGVARLAGMASVTSMCPFDDGSGAGPALFVAGSFLFAGPISAMNVARWRGAEGWSNAGTTPNGTFFYALAPFDDHTGAGPALFAGTLHETIGGSEPPIQALFKWDGVAWAPVPGALASDTQSSTIVGIRSLRAWDSGDGERLYIGGEFTAFGGAPGHAIVRWDGAAFDHISPFGYFSDARDIEVATIDGAPALFVGGLLNAASPGALSGSVVRFDGEHWSSTGPGLNGGRVYALSVSPGAGDDSLSAGGGGGVAPVAGVSLGELHGDHWDYLPINDPGLGLDRDVTAMTTWDDGAGPRLYVGGIFDALPVPRSPGLALFDGDAWSPFGADIGGTISALLPVHDAAGDALILAGQFSAHSSPAEDVARWDGVSLSPMGALWKFTEGALALAKHGEGAALELVASGWMAHPSFPSSPNLGRVARWMGADWAPLGSEFDTPPLALAFHDGALYAGGNFSRIGLPQILSLARWDGAQWSSPAAFNSRVTALFEFDDGSGAGPALYVGGAFTRINNIPFNRVARLRNGVWENIGSFFAAPASFAVVDSGRGPRLHACGNLLIVQGASASNIAEWDGVSCAVAPATTDGEVRAIASLTDPATGRISILAGGSFTHAGGLFSSHFARFDPCQLSCPGDADHNGVIDFLDLNILLDHYGQTSPPGTFDPADFNLDGVVDFLDLNELLSDYGGVCNS